MSGEALFKSIVSGEDQSVLGDIALSVVEYSDDGPA